MKERHKVLKTVLQLGGNNCLAHSEFRAGDIQELMDTPAVSTPSATMLCSTACLVLFLIHHMPLLKIRCCRMRSSDSDEFFQESVTLLGYAQHHDSIGLSQRPDRSF